MTTDDLVKIPCAVTITLTREQFETIRSQDDLERALTRCLVELVVDGKPPYDLDVLVKDWESGR